MKHVGTKIRLATFLLGVTLAIYGAIIHHTWIFCIGTFLWWGSLFFGCMINNQKKQVNK